jgi:hypothetical protein
LMIWFTSANLAFEPRPTACVTGAWAGVDFAWEQKKLEARKMLVNRAESHTSGARFVGRDGTKDSLAKKDITTNLKKICTQLTLWREPKH